MFFQNPGLHVEFHEVSAREGQRGSQYAVKIWGKKLAPEDVEQLIPAHAEGVKAQLDAKGKFSLELQVLSRELNTLLYQVGRHNRRMGLCRISKSDLE